MCTLTLSSVKDAYLVVQGLVVQGLIPTISTLGREVAPYIGAKQSYKICLLPLRTVLRWLGGAPGIQTQDLTIMGRLL